MLQNRMSDFSVYRVNDTGGDAVLSIYLGNFPKSYPSPKDAIRSTSTIGGYKATLERWSGQGGRLSGSTLVELAHSSDWPQVASLLFIDLPKTEAGVAEAIVRSFRRDPSERTAVEH